MTGDEIRAIKFARMPGGYDVREVSTWLSDVATCLDAGARPAIFVPLPKFRQGLRIGYDTQAVDRLASALGFSDVAEATDVVDVPGRQVAAQGESSDFLQSRQYAKDCDAEWSRVSALPGTRLRWRDLPTGRRNLSDGQLLPQAGRDQAWVDPATGDPVLWVVGTHSYHKDTAVVLLPGGRWLRFPVRGTRLGNAVMTAATESATSLLWFRKVGLAGDWRGPAAVEVVVSPEREITPDILRIATLGVAWLVNYFVEGH